MSLLKKNNKYIPYQASSFWLNRDFDTNWANPNSNKLDFTKLAAAQRAIGNFVNIVTGKSIPVVFQSNDSSFTDGTTVTIGTKLDGTNFDPAVGLALHEGSHIAHTDFSLFKGIDGKYTSYIGNTLFANIIRLNGLDPNLNMSTGEFNIIKDLLNWIEDRRIDYKIYTTAPGYRLYYESMYNKYFNDTVIDKALISYTKKEETLDDYLFHIINFTNPNRKLNTLKNLLKIWNIIDLKNIQRLQSTKDALLIACDVYKILKESIPEPNQTQTTSDGDDAASSDESGDSGGDSDESGDSGGDSDESGDSDDPNANKQQAESNNSDTLSAKDLQKLDKAITKQHDFLSNNMIKKGKLSKSDARAVNAIREAGCETIDVATNSDGTADIVETVVIKKLTNEIICSLPNLFSSYAYDYISGKRNYEKDLAEQRGAARYLRDKQTAVETGLVLGMQLGRKLQLRNSDRSLKTTRLETGKIDRRLISQLGYNNINVFHRIVTDRFKNYFIHISIDASGSMSGDKFENAITSAVAVAKAASMTQGIRVQISLRGTSTLDGKKEKAITIYAYDSAKDKINKIRTMFKYLSPFGCTPEGIAFKSIEKYIKADAKGDECIFVNYSDGEPTDVTGVGYSYNGADFTKKIINNFREIGINIISYYITSGTHNNMKDLFRHMYGPDALFIKPINMIEISKTLNQKFLEIAK